MLEYPKTYGTADGRLVTVLAFNQSWYAEKRCYEIVLSGAVDAFFGASEILARRELPDGSTQFWYIPDHDDPDYQFDRDFAAKLDKLGAWGKE